MQKAKELLDIEKTDYLGEFETGMIAKVSYLRKTIMQEVEYARTCIKNYDEDREWQEQVLENMLEFLEVIENYQNEDVVGVYIHPMDATNLVLMDEAQLENELTLYI